MHLRKVCRTLHWMIPMDDLVSAVVRGRMMLVLPTTYIVVSFSRVAWYVAVRRFDSWSSMYAVVT
jgi:hypothetical protein